MDNPAADVIDAESTEHPDLRNYAVFFQRTPHNTFKHVQPAFPAPEYELDSTNTHLPTGSIVESKTNGDSDSNSPRGKWGSKWEFILSCIGLSVGIGNVWRFPMLAYENGGGAFLIPYFILLLLIGKPMYFMEIALGQYAQLGPIAVWRMAPLFTGVGFAMVTVTVIVAIYYNTIMSYTVFYMAASCASELPWSSCEQWWGADEFCFSRTADLDRVYNGTGTFFDAETNTLYYNGSRVCSHHNVTDTCVNVTLQTATKQYWEKYVLGLKPDGLMVFGDIGNFRWQLVLCLIFCWVVVYLCVMKGIKSSGKVVYFTATFPYVILIALLIRGVTLDGAVDGIKYFFIPTWEKLLTLQVWRKAAEQMFYSLSISWGCLIMFGSYNEFHNKVHKDAVLISLVDFGTSIIAGIAVFSILGALAKETGVNIDEIAISGPGLAFIAYPEAISRLPVPQLWSILFFLMLFTLGLDSEFALVEQFVTCIYDAWPHLRKFKVIITLLTCCSFFLLGLPTVCEAGTYVFDLMDNYGGGTAVLIVGIFEMIGIMWVYGVSKFSDDLEYMLGERPSWYWRICWAVCSPILLVVIFISSLFDYKNPMMGPQEYPSWAIGIGWTLACISVVQIPLWMIIQTYRHARQGDVRGVLRPALSWGPAVVSNPSLPFTSAYSTDTLIPAKDDHGA